MTIKKTKHKDPVLIFVPTYNEKDNVKLLVDELVKLYPGIDILFIDDNSPDGTGDVLDGLAKKNKNLKIVHRAGKNGIGSAHQSGIKYAYDHKYKILITMDADFSHPPEYIADLLNYSDHSVVVGSRYLKKKSLSGWNILRKILTMAGHFATNFFLRMPYDATGAFRLYRLDIIPHEAFLLVSSFGYSFFFESLFILNINKFKIKEIPIHLPARTYGHSKMKLKDAFQSLLFLASIYLNTLVNKEKFLVSLSEAPKINKKLIDLQDWDTYWQNQKKPGGLIYDAVAAFYRKFIIKRNLRSYLKRRFEEGSTILHAGCGSGQVDVGLHEYFKIIAMDISINALMHYNKVNTGHIQLLHESIFDTRLPKNSLDGVYNLGVMEHFTREEIDRILAEFFRILKPGGKIVLFWPPEYGSSVIFLKGVHYLLNNILKKNVKLHPDEISRIKSKKHAIEIIRSNGFTFDGYYFNLKDFFTYSVIVGVKKL
jgi:dolichol-phosphate mannosyltransferase